MIPNKRLTILQPEVRLIDPHTNTDNRNILSPLLNIFDTLVKVDRKGAYKGSLAYGWDVSADARKWTLYLRQSVTFHNGEMLTASDVVASIYRILAPEADGELATQGIYQRYLEGARIYELDQFTVQIETPSPMADMLDFLVKFPIIPRSQINELPEKMNGTGPFQLTCITPGRIEMTAFAEHWGGVPNAREVIWEAEPNPLRRVEALLGGHADLISTVPPIATEEIRCSKTTLLATIESSVCTVFMCNQMHGVCTDRRVRQALNIGLNKEELIQSVMKGAARPLNGPLTGLHFGYNPETPVYTYDPVLAKAILAEAGFPEEKRLKLVLDVPLTLPDEAPALAQHMAMQYRRIGIETVVKEFNDRTDYAFRVRSKQINDACCFDSSPLSTYQVFSDKFHSGLRGAWWQGYQNLQVDALIDQARATPNNSRRQQLYQQAYQLVSEDAPWIFLYNPILIWAFDVTVKWWQPTLDGLIHLG